MIQIMQGSRLEIPLGCTADDAPVNPLDFSKVFFNVCGYGKTWPGEVTYNESEAMWMFPLTQEESMALSPGVYKAQARFLYKSGSIEGVNLGDIEITAGADKAVI